MMKKVFKALFSLLILLLFFTACNKKEQPDIMTTLYPQYDIAKQIAGNKLTVSLMIPFGSEIHDFEPTAKDIIRVKNSKLFIYTSDEMERWSNNIIDESTNALKLSKTYKLIPYENENAIIDELHYWTDPTTIMQIINVVKNEIIKIDSENEEYYEENANRYLEEINTVHEEIKTFLASKDNPRIFFYGHNAMAAFGSRYNLEIVSLSLNYKPDAELLPGQILALKNKIKAENIKYLFVEELIDLKSPNTLKNELTKEGYPISILELHGFHNISKKQNEEAVSYVDLLRQNFENLKTALS